MDLFFPEVRPTHPLVSALACQKNLLLPLRRVIKGNVLQGSMSENLLVKATVPSHFIVNQRFSRKGSLRVYLCRVCCKSVENTKKET